MRMHHVTGDVVLPTPEFKNLLSSLFGEEIIIETKGYHFLVPSTSCVCQEAIFFSLVEYFLGFDSIDPPKYGEIYSVKFGGALPRILSLFSLVFPNSHGSRDLEEILGSFGIETPASHDVAMWISDFEERGGKTLDFSFPSDILISEDLPL